MNDRLKISERYQKSLVESVEGSEVRVPSDHIAVVPLEPKVCLVPAV